MSGVLSHLRCLCVIVWVQIFCDLVFLIYSARSVNTGREDVLLYYLASLNVVVSVDRDYFWFVLSFL